MSLKLAMLYNGISVWASKQDSFNSSLRQEMRGTIIPGAGNVEDNSHLRGQHKQSPSIGL